MILAGEDAEEEIGGKASVAFSSRSGSVSQSDSVEVRDSFYKNKAIVIEKG